MDLARSGPAKSAMVYPRRFILPLSILLAGEGILRAAEAALAPEAIPPLAAVYLLRSSVVQRLVIPFRVVKLKIGAKTPAGVPKV